MCFDSAHKRFWFIDHFLGQVLADEWESHGDAGGSAVVQDQMDGGVVRITTGTDDNDGWRIEWELFILQVSKDVTMEWRFRAPNIADMKMSMYLIFDADEYIEVAYDTDLGHTTWQIACNDAGAITDEDSGETVDTDWHIGRIQCLTDGVHFFIDDLRNEVTGSPITTNITARYLQPFFWIQTRIDTVAKILDLDYVDIRQYR